MNSDTLLFDLADHVAIITLNRAAVRNAMNRKLSGALIAALQRVREDADIRVAVSTGAGRTFSAGADLKEPAQSGRAADASAASIIETSRAGGFATLTMPKPLLAAVDGYCLAAGFELALLCDMRICTPEARFGLPEITRGFFPDRAESEGLEDAIDPGTSPRDDQGCKNPTWPVHRMLRTRVCVHERCDHIQIKEVDEE